MLRPFARSLTRGLHLMDWVPNQLNSLSFEIDDQKGMWKGGTFCTLYVHFMLYHVWGFDWNSWY